MSDQGGLERRYRRLLACYPRAFRREHEEEMLVVLLACARDGRRRPGLADSVNLLGHAVRLRLRPVAQRSVPTIFWGVRLALLAAVLEIAALVTVVASEGAVHATVLRHVAGFTSRDWAAVVRGQILPVEIGAPIVAVSWLALAWANDRGRRWARTGMVVELALASLSLLTAVARHAGSYAPADLAVGAALCAVALVATLLIICNDSDRHYDRARREGVTGQGWRGRTDVASWN